MKETSISIYLYEKLFIKVSAAPAWLKNGIEFDEEAGSDEDKCIRFDEETGPDKEAGVDFNEAAK